MKVETLTNEVAAEIEAAWLRSWSHQPDYAKDWAYVAWLLTQSDMQLYRLDGHSAWIYLTDITPGVEATMHALNLEGQAGVDRPAARKEILSAMREFNLHRLTVTIPAAFHKLNAATKELGFRREGKMREAAIYDGKYVDMNVYGLMRREVEHDEIKSVAPPLRKKRRRRRRSRRKAAGANGSTQWQDKNQAQSELKEEGSSPPQVEDSFQSLPALIQ